MQSKEQIEHEIIQRKARELELSKAYEDNHDALMFALGRKQCYDEVMADMDRRIKEAVEKALASKPVQSEMVEGTGSVVINGT